jgi:hypothetical protein
VSLANAAQSWRFRHPGSGCRVVKLAISPPWVGLSPPWVGLLGSGCCRLSPPWVGCANQFAEIGAWETDRAVPESLPLAQLTQLGACSPCPIEAICRQARCASHPSVGTSFAWGTAMANCRYTRIAALIALSLLPCCGGTTGADPASPGGGVGGQTSSTGGAGGAVGGNAAVGGQKPTGGANSAGTGGMVVCCNAMPVCSNGDQEIPSQDSCPSNAECYSMSICCTTIWCAKASSACDPTTEYNRKYLATGDNCQLVKFTCPANTTVFFNSCGCGCQQDASCPQYVDCMPGPGTSDPLCGATGADDRCPYSPRAM